MYTEQLTQEIGICAPYQPAQFTNASKLVGGVDMSLFKRAFFAVIVGANAGNVTLQLVEDTQQSLATATNLAGNNTSITPITIANKQYTLEARADQMTKRYLGLKITENNVGNVTLAGFGLGMDSIHKPGNANNDATVTTQNVVS